MKCPACGALNTDEFQHCRKCGTYVSPLYQQPKPDETTERAVPRMATGEPLDPERIGKSMRTLEPVIGGIMIMIVCVGAYIVSVAMYHESLNYNELNAPIPQSYVDALLKLTILTAPIGIVGGVAAIMRNNFLFANAAGAAATLTGVLVFGVGLLAALIAWGLVATSKGEFRPIFGGAGNPQTDSLAETDQ
jgi:hypothetical protein